jgi:HAD superfamily hydrolase (TIGR01458 family)
MRPADACIIDIDGTLFFAGSAIPGAANAIVTLREAGLPMCFATNTTRWPRSELVSRLAALGIDVRVDELHTAPVAAALWLAEQGARRVSLLLAEATFEEFAEFERDDVSPDFVVVGDLAERWNFEVLNTAFLALERGARLVAIQKNRSWQSGHGLQLDAGPFVAALEFATGQEAVLVGKPSPAFYATAAANLGGAADRIAVVGDSLVNDVRGGHDGGCLGVAVRTGTFDEAGLGELDRPPDAVLDSIADLPNWLGIS